MTLSIFSTTTLMCVKQITFTHFFCLMSVLLYVKQALIIQL
jgi:hypothetical protein